MNVSTVATSRSSANYAVIAPISMGFALVAVVIASMILVLVLLTKQLHTVTHLLICNTCVASILYCIVQWNSYIYLLFITWDISDQSCRWRGYFGYMSIVAMAYSYLLQAISRLFFTVLYTKYRWLISLKTHVCMLCVKWIIVLAVPLPALVTNDIYFRAGFLCWVPKRSMLHVVYTILAYYLIPIFFLITIYIYIYVRIHYDVNNTVVQGSRRRNNRDLAVLRNIIILFGIYILGAVPSIFYMLTGIELFYSIGIISVSFTVAIEKSVTILLDREIRNVFKKYFCRCRTQTVPMAFNVPAIAK